MNIPGDPTSEEREEAYEQLHQRAVEMWGAGRAAGIEESLRAASLAIARLERVRFSRNDVPGFYLHESRPGGPWDSAS